MLLFSSFKIVFFADVQSGVKSRVGGEQFGNTFYAESTKGVFLIWLEQVGLSQNAQ